MTGLTLIQCHFVHGQLNHRIRFGTPDKIIKLDKYRKLACFFNGPRLVKRALKAFDRVEAETAGDLNSLSESYWMTFQNDLGARNSMAAHRRDVSMTEVSHAR